MNFQGLAAPLSPQCLDQISATLQANLPAIWAVLSVETAGSGYLSDRRPKILFERHQFHRLSQGQFDTVAPDLSQATAGGYGAEGANQYDRLTRAMALDETAALSSTSWGLGQIMGFNADKVGFADVREMITAFTESEDQQIGAMAAFISQAGLGDALRSGDWTTFASGYNGPNYQQDGYQKKLAVFHARYAIGPLPDLLVRGVQIALIFSGLPGVGGVDGWFGENTQNALLKFQEDSGLPQSGQPDDVTVAALMMTVGW